MKLKRTILKFQYRFSRTQFGFWGMFRKQKCSLGSYLIVGKEKSEKNHFTKFLEFFENFDEVFFLDFDFIEWAELTVSAYRVIEFRTPIPKIYILGSAPFCGRGLISPMFVIRTHGCVHYMGLVWIQETFTIVRTPFVSYSAYSWNYS